MKDLIFFGSDQYSATTLAAILEYRNTGKPVNILVVTDHKLGGTEVEKLAKTHNLKVTYYPTNPDEMIKFNDLMVKWFNGEIITGLCASFDHLIPPDIIEKFGGQLYNLHPSLLPQYRNVSPVQYAIALGDQETGITLFRIAPGIDDGEIIAQISEPILPDDTTSTLTTRLFKKGADLFLQLLQGSVLCNTLDTKVGNKGRILVTPTHKLIFTHRLTRNSGFIEWPLLHQLLQNQPISLEDTKNELLILRLKKEIATHSRLTSNIYLLDLMRALNPWPGVWSTVPTKKGNLRISLIYDLRSMISILISGKPKPISYADFTKYYL